jgi:thioredoxin-like negative regulator of GroEL
MNHQKLKKKNTLVFCFQRARISGYPTIVLFFNGQSVDEYRGEFEVKPMWEYILTKSEFHYSGKLPQLAVADEQPDPLAEFSFHGDHDPTLHENTK